MYLNHCTKCGQKCFYKQCFYIVKLQYESDFIFFNVHTKYKILPTNLIYVDLQKKNCVQCYLYPRVVHLCGTSFNSIYVAQETWVDIDETLVLDCQKTCVLLVLRNVQSLGLLWI